MVGRIMYYKSKRLPRKNGSLYKLNMQNVFFLLTMIVFLTPQCMDYILPHSRIIVYCLRMVLLTFFLLSYKTYFPSRKDRELYYLSLYIMAFGTAQSIAEIIKTVNPLSIRFLLFYSGFSIVMIKMLRENPHQVLHALFLILGIYNFIQILTVLLFYPQGMTPKLGTDSSKTVYFLGGKNQAFVFMLLFLLIVTIKGIQDKGKIPKTVFWILLAFIIEAYILDSMATVICLILLAIGYALEITKLYKHIQRLLNPYFLLLMISIVFSIFCIANSLTDFLRTSSIAKLLYKFNRNLTFTGRTFLWQQAISMFTKNPIIGGNGNFSIVGINLNQAHNAFLDILSKYGLISFIPFLLFVFCVASNLLKIKNNKKLYTICSFSFFILLLHCCFEYMDMYVLFIFAFIIVAVRKENT